MGSGSDHLAIQVDALAAPLEQLTDADLELEPVEHPGGPHDPKTSWLTAPDGYRIETSLPSGPGARRLSIRVQRSSRLRRTSRPPKIRQARASATSREPGSLFVMSKR